MVTAKIIDITEEEGEQPRYHIPLHRISSLKPGSGMFKTALGAKGIPCLASVYKSLVECFNKDGPRGMYHGDARAISGIVFISGCKTSAFLPRLSRIWTGSLTETLLGFLWSRTPLFFVEGLVLCIFD